MHAANGNLELSSECEVQYICRHGRQTNDFLVSCHFGPIICRSHDFTGFWHVSFICLDIQELVPIVPLKHAANGNLESSSECVVQYICRHGGQNGQYANSAIENSADAMPCHAHKGGFPQRNQSDKRGNHNDIKTFRPKPIRHWRWEILKLKIFKSESMALILKPNIYLTSNILDANMPYPCSLFYPDIKYVTKSDIRLDTRLNSLNVKPYHKSWFW